MAANLRIYLERQVSRVEEEISAERDRASTDGHRLERLRALRRNLKAELLLQPCRRSR